MMKKRKWQEPIRRTIVPNLSQHRTYHLRSQRPVFFQKVKNSLPLLQFFPVQIDSQQEQATPVNNHKFLLSNRIKSLSLPRQRSKPIKNTFYSTGMPQNKSQIKSKKDRQRKLKFSDNANLSKQYQTINGTAIGSLSTYSILEQIERNEEISKFLGKWFLSQLKKQGESDNEEEVFDLPALGEHSTILKNSSQRKYSIDSQRARKIKKPTASQLYQRVMGEETNGEKSNLFQSQLLAPEKQEYFKKEIKVDCKQEWRF